MRKQGFKRAVYAGSFDPPTNGHLWMIQEGCLMFDELIVAIGVNPDKRYTYSVNERKKILEKIIHEEGYRNVVVDSYENSFLVNYAVSVEADYILRGIRSPSDYEFERSMRYINGDSHPDISTVFLIPPREYAEVSSTMVKGMVGPENWQQMIKRYVPEAVLEKIMSDYHDDKANKE